MTDTPSRADTENLADIIAAAFHPEISPYRLAQAVLGAGYRRILPPPPNCGDAGASLECQRPAGHPDHHAARRPSGFLAMWPAKKALDGAA